MLCPFYEIAHFVKQASQLPISLNGKNSCPFHGMGNFTDWAQDIYLDSGHTDI